MNAATEIVNVIADFCTALRMGSGVDENALGQLRKLMDTLREDWANQRVVPREAAGALAELVPAMESASYVYDEQDAERIRDLAADLSDEVSSVFFGQPG